MGEMKKILKLADAIKAELKKGVEDYHTGLLGEQMIVASYQTMPLDKLEKLRFILNGIIKKKKELMRFGEAQKEKEKND